jgi:hypothetical protein
VGRRASASVDQRAASGTGCLTLVGSSLVVSRQQQKGNARAAQSATDIRMPRLSSLWPDMDPAEARRLELWGRAIIEDICAFRHRQMRRREGVGR